jgi:hypothetical protein
VKVRKKVNPYFLSYTAWHHDGVFGHKNHLTLLSHGMWRRDTCMEKFLSNGTRKENVKCVSSRKKIKNT